MINNEPKLTVRLATIIGIAAVSFHFFAFILFFLTMSIIVGISFGIESIISSTIEVFGMIFNYKPTKKN